MNNALFTPSTRRLLAALPPSVVRRVMYRRRYGRWGDLSRPTRFTEHLNRRMLVDRSEELAQACDKTAMKTLASAACPELEVAPTLWSGTDIRRLDLGFLPEQWVIKPNHASSMVHFGNRGTTHRELRRATRGWLHSYDRTAVGEWGYSRAERMLMVEPRIGGGEPLADYKIYVFHGRAKMLHVDVGRFSDRFGEQFFTPQWEPLAIANGAPLPSSSVLEAPESLEIMISCAERLGADFEFMRVDFYEADGVAWFGELTPYPSGGMDPFEPDAVDLQMGAWWRGEKLEEPALVVGCSG